MKAAVCFAQGPACVFTAPHSAPAAHSSKATPRAVQCQGLLDGFLVGGSFYCAALIAGNLSLLLANFRS